MKKSTRVKAESFSTETEFTEAVDRVTWIEIETRRLALQRDAVVLRVKDRYNAKIEALTAERDLKATRCALYAQENRPTLLPDETKAKCRATRTSWWGFRLGNKKLETIKGWTWGKVFDEIKSRGLLDFIRVKEELDREIMTNEAKRHGNFHIYDEAGRSLDTVKLKDVGVELVQDETFYIEPQIEEKGAA